MKELKEDISNMLTAKFEHKKLQEILDEVLKLSGPGLPPTLNLPMNPKLSDNKYSEENRMMSSSGCSPSLNPPMNPTKSENKESESMNYEKLIPRLIEKLDKLLQI